MKRLPLPLLVALFLSSRVPEAQAIPNCGPGYRAEPSYDSNGEPQPGGSCVPIDEPPEAPPSVRPAVPADAAPAPKPSATFDARPATPSSATEPATPDKPEPATGAPAERKKSGCGGCSSSGASTGGLALLVLVVLLAGRSSRSRLPQGALGIDRDRGER